MSAVVVNWNGAADLREALSSLVSQTYPNLEVIVVDNGSEDESSQVAEGFGVRWLPLGRNLGLAPAMNEGARAATGEYLLFLNNDMRFAPDFVECLEAALAAHPDAFAADAKQFNWEGTEVVHSQTLLQPSTSVAPPIPNWCLAQLDTAETAPCVFGSAANLMVRRDQFWELGGWDAGYLIGSEDLDLCLRAWARGWKTLYVPEAVCWHRVGAAGDTPTGARTRLYGSATGTLRLAAIHLPTHLWLLVLGRFVAGTLKDVVGQPHRGVVRLRALWRFAASAPDILRRRRALNRWGPPTKRLRAVAEI
ncbi:MAG: glycosyltransferase family 2 protein [Armatimonadota bacterium]|nr:glycosyltransferase family 2 protein [Armatimonadota bacterium]